MFSSELENLWREKKIQYNKFRITEPIDTFKLISS